jgi:hypothetical protein
VIVIFRVLGDGTENTAIVALGLRLWVFVSNWAFLSLYLPGVLTARLLGGKAGYCI